jgi:Ni/Fe-hydrogenase subunit HybB-like protein
MSHVAEALGGQILTKPFKLLLTIFGVGASVMLWRFISGLGATTALNDGYPWGLWITFDVVVGTALGCGGYAMAILVYVLNKGEFHPLVRPAILTSALGYSLAGVGVVLDVGRYWNLYKVFNPLMWNLNSVLLEVALCIMAYVVVLWIELSPALLEGRSAWVPKLLLQRKLGFTMADGGQPRSTSSRYPGMSTWMIWLLALGLLLPTMHQSSLGSVLLIATTKLNKLWHTPLLPLLFLISCVGMGYAVVVFESALSSAVFKRPPDTRLLGRLSKPIAAVLFLFLGVRVLDLIGRGRIGAIFSLDRYSCLFLLETGLFLLPALMLLSRRRNPDLGHLFRAGMLILLAGILYRFDVFLIAFNPGRSWSYFPSITEMLVTAGILALEIMAYVAIVKRFPILGGVRPSSSGWQAMNGAEVTR